MSIKYSEDHEWVDAKEDDLVVIGITDFAQEQLGDLVYVELPEVGDECTKGENISVIESVNCLLYTSPSPRDRTRSRMPSSA